MESRGILRESVVTSRDSFTTELGVITQFPKMCLDLLEKNNKWATLDMHELFYLF